MLTDAVSRKTMKGVIIAQEQEKVKSWEKLEMLYCGSHNEQNLSQRTAEKHSQVMSKFCIFFACFFVVLVLKQDITARTYDACVILESGILIQVRH
jgi:hypothetical protein